MCTRASAPPETVQAPDDLRHLLQARAQRLGRHRPLAVDLDVGLGRPAQCVGVDQRGEAADRTRGAQAVDPPLDGRRGQAHLVADLGVGGAGVGEQAAEHRLVDGVHAAILTGRRSPPRGGTGPRRVDRCRSLPEGPPPERSPVRALPRIAVLALVWPCSPAAAPTSPSTTTARPAPGRGRSSTTSARRSRRPSSGRASRRERWRARLPLAGARSAPTPGRRSTTRSTPPRCSRCSTRWRSTGRRPCRRPSASSSPRPRATSTTGPRSSAVRAAARSRPRRRTRSTVPQGTSSPGTSRAWSSPTTCRPATSPPPSSSPTSSGTPCRPASSARSG